eukprot:CAMPEP_0202979952 /NCGR_PEP_ID=MMETSP1396-20130829/85966_1 /ASSEMBLY_ACC=CAM_ASM_000872 /TAXON_ID= /ORGANISM="Pseudokeronopsis sp., Strain Brazil" /LENGTH=170 /DNA_ID=CAMNT_0049719619 /DNA_START=383 /DNA_END=896 /DNA_ORIENTATION=+
MRRKTTAPWALEDSNRRANLPTSTRERWKEFNHLSINYTLRATTSRITSANLLTRPTLPFLTRSTPSRWKKVVTPGPPPPAPSEPALTPDEPHRQCAPYQHFPPAHPVHQQVGAVLAALGNWREADEFAVGDAAVGEAGAESEADERGDGCFLGLDEDGTADGKAESRRC